MKHLILIGLFLTSFLGVRLAELSCLCFEDSQTITSTQVKASTHHEHSDSEEEHDDHCQHLCSQCHFAAIVPLRFDFPPFLGAKHSILTLITSKPEARTLGFLRPPIPEFA